MIHQRIAFNLIYVVLSAFIFYFYASKIIYCEMITKQLIQLGLISLLTLSASDVFAQKQVIQFFAHRGSRLEFDENTM